MSHRSSGGYSGTGETLRAPGDQDQTRRDVMADVRPSN